MKRDDLRVWKDQTGSGMDLLHPVSDADLASLGYVKLDGINVEALRGEMLYATPHARLISPAIRLAAAYLAAIDQEDAE